MARLGDICEKVTDYVASGSFAALKENVLITNEENYAIMVKTADFSNGFTKALTYTDKRGYDFLKNSNLFGGELILSNIGSIGKVFKVPYLDRPMTLASNTVMIKTATPELTDYLYYYFLSPAGYKSLLSISSGTSMLKFNKTELKKLEIPIPDIDKQRHIIAVMDKVSDLISLRKQQLSKLDELVKARFVELFGDYIQRSNKVFLEEISDFVTVGIANSATHAYTDSGIVMLRNQNIKENYLDENDLIYITPDFAKKYGSKQLAENDILVIRTGYPGVACLVPKKYEGCQTFTTLIVRLKTATQTHANYVCHYINSSFGKDYVEQSKVGVAQQNFGAKALAKMPIAVPPEKLQEQFAAFVEQTDKSKLAVQQSLDKLELLKKALMQKYFG